MRRFADRIGGPLALFRLTCSTHEYGYVVAVKLGRLLKSVQGDVGMQRYYILEREMDAEDEGFASVVSQAYALREKPVCLCRRDEVLPLYISFRHNQHVLSRWPGTGAKHAPGCEHYEAPDFLTGLGQVRGSAIVEDQDTGDTDLKFAFPLSRGPARAAPAALTNDKPSVQSNGQRLSMRGMLHYLWDRAQLTHWHPKMKDKRNWYIVRRALQAAALSCRARGENFGKTLFIPETFRLEKKDEIAARRESELMPVHASRDAIMVVIGEVKSIEEARFGEKILLRHLPDWPFVLDKDMARRFHRRFAVEQQLWNSDGGKCHLVMAGTFSLSDSGLPELIEVTIMPVTEQWLPFETLDERRLIDKAIADERRFVKGLRVNLARDVPIASLSLTDTGPSATAVFLAHNRVDPAYDEALHALMNTPGVEHIVWRTGAQLPGARSTRTARPARSNLTLQ